MVQRRTVRLMAPLCWESYNVGVYPYRGDRCEVARLGYAGINHEGSICTIDAGQLMKSQQMVPSGKRLQKTMENHHGYNGNNSLFRLGHVQ